jgi:hypothetical protein
MENDITPPGDNYTIRCPKLGHSISFSYCRSENMGIPCFKTLDCWFEHFPVERHLREILTEEEWDKAFMQAGKSKVLSILEQIERAKNIRIF